MDTGSSIFVAGHRGLVGSAILRKLKDKGFHNLIVKSRNELDLIDQQAVNQFFKDHEIDYVFLAAAKVGGIHANNTYPAQFLYQNLQIQNNVIHASHISKVKKLLFLGSSCVYPKFSPLPIKEESLLTSSLEPTNEAYAIAKIAGIKMVQAYNREYGDNFISVMPTNLYGLNDNYHPSDSHVLAALVKKIVDAKKTGAGKITLWGTGEPKREFLCADDLADACVYLMNNYNSPEIINIGTGKEISILDLAHLIMEVAEVNLEIEHDLSKPDGTPRKVMDVSKLNKLGWNPKISLKQGLKMVIDDYSMNHYSN